MKEVQKNRARNKFYKVISLFLVPFLALFIVNYTVPFNVSTMNPVEYTGIKKTSLKEAVSLEETMGLKKHSFSSDNNEMESKSSEIIAIFKCKVKPGMLKQNKEIWQYFVNRFRTNEPGWKGNSYYNSDESIVTYIEIFKDLKAFENHEKEHLKNLWARKKWEETAEVISAEFYGMISTESSELLTDKSVNKKFSGNFKF